MLLEIKKYLYDIERALNLIGQFTHGKTWDDYQLNPLLQSAVERQFEIVGEALNKLGHVDPSIISHITEFRRIVAFRDILIHGYDTVSLELVWDVIQTNIPILAKEILYLQAEAEKQHPASDR